MRGFVDCVLVDFEPILRKASAQRNAKDMSRTGLCSLSNRSLDHQNGNRKNASRDSPRERAGFGHVPRSFPTSETRPVSLTHGNVVRSPTQGNDGAETALGG